MNKNEFMMNIMKFYIYHQIRDIIKINQLISKLDEDQIHLLYENNYNYIEDEKVSIEELIEYLSIY